VLSGRSAANPPAAVAAVDRWHRQRNGRTLNGYINPAPQLVAWHSGRTSVSGRRTFPVLRSTCSWWVPTNVGKPSATGQPTIGNSAFHPFWVDKWVVKLESDVCCRLQISAYGTLLYIPWCIITEYLKIYYLHYPSGMLEDWLFFAI